MAQIEEEAAQKRQRHEEEIACIRDNKAQKRQRHEMELVELSARSYQKVEKSYYTNLGNVAKALADGLIDQAEHDQTLSAIRSQRAEAIKIFSAGARHVPVVEREMKRRVESDEHPKPATERDPVGWTLLHLQHKRRAFEQKLFVQLQNMRNVKVRTAKLEQVQEMLLEKKDHLYKAYDYGPEMLKILVDNLNKNFAPQTAPVSANRSDDFGGESDTTGSGSSDNELIWI